MKPFNANDIIKQAEQLPPHEKLALIERLVPGLEKQLQEDVTSRRFNRSLREILLDEIRRDVWRTLPRREYWCPPRAAG